MVIVVGERGGEGELSRSSRGVTLVVEEVAEGRNR